MKKFWITVSALAFLGVWTLLYIPYNLSEYNFYYATHMKHKHNQYPFMVALAMAKLPPEYLPDFHVEYFAKRDTQDNTLTKESVLTKGDYLELSATDIFYATSKKAFRNDDFSGSVFIDNNGTVDNDGPSKYNKGLIKVLDDTQAELKRNSEKPLINLQRIYNWYFYF